MAKLLTIRFELLAVIQEPVGRESQIRLFSSILHATWIRRSVIACRSTYGARHSQNNWKIHNFSAFEMGRAWTCEDECWTCGTCVWAPVQTAQVGTYGPFRYEQSISSLHINENYGNLDQDCWNFTLLFVKTSQQNCVFMGITALVPIRERFSCSPKNTLVGFAASYQRSQQSLIPFWLLTFFTIHRHSGFEILEIEIFEIWTCVLESHVPHVLEDAAHVRGAGNFF